MNSVIICDTDADIDTQIHAVTIETDITVATFVKKNLSAPTGAPELLELLLYPEAICYPI